MQHLFSPHNRLLILSSLSICLLCTVFAYLWQAERRFMQAMLAHPIATISEFTTQNISHIYGEAFAYDALLQENKALEEKIKALEKHEKENRLLTHENARLRRLLDFSKTKSMSSMPCQIISFGSSNWERSYLLDKGTKHGISLGQSVIDEHGRLLGFISEVGKHSATLRSVLDPKTNFGVSIASTEDTAILQSNVSDMTTGLLTLTQIPRSSQIEPFDHVVTLPTPDYPSALSIGTIASIEMDPSGLYQVAKVRPYATTHKQRQVFVVTSFS